MSAYWERRTRSRIIQSERTGARALSEVVPIYEKALQNINKDINRIYVNYSTNVGLDVSELSKILSDTDKSDFLLSVQQNMVELGFNVDQFYNPDYIERLTILEAKKQQIYWEIQKIAPKEIDITTEAYEQIIDDAFAVTKKDIRNSLGSLRGFAEIDQTTLDSMLNKNWERGNYKTRVMRNVDKLAIGVKETIGAGILTGISADKMIRQMREEFGASMYDTTRLIKTETNYFQNQATLESFKDEGINYYEYDAILDELTSQICQDLNGLTFRVDDSVVGLNYPPLHPNCRSTIRLLFDSEVGKVTTSGDIARLRHEQEEERYEKQQERKAKKKEGFVDERFETAMRGLEGKGYKNIKSGEALVEEAKTFYRGVGEQPGSVGGVSTLGSGVYSSEDYEKAKQYGEVQQVSQGDIPEKPLVLEGYKEVMPLMMKASEEGVALEKYVQSLGYDGVQVFEGGKVIEQVKYKAEGLGSLEGAVKKVYEPIVLGKRNPETVELPYHINRFLEENEIDIIQDSKKYNAGTYDHSIRELYVKSRVKGGKGGTLYHEIGHAIDYMNVDVPKLREGEYSRLKRGMGVSKEYASAYKKAEGAERLIYKEKFRGLHRDIDPNTSWGRIGGGPLSKESQEIVRERWVNNIKNSDLPKHGVVVTDEVIEEVMKGRKIDIGGGRKWGERRGYKEYLRKDEEVFADGWKQYNEKPKEFKKYAPKFYDYFKDIDNLLKKKYG